MLFAPIILNVAFLSAPTLMAHPGYAHQAPMAQVSYTPHAPILITGNSGFTAPNGITSGSGTVMDPYIIQGWDINSSTATGIQISNSNVYFTVRNVFIHSVTLNHMGIVLSHLVNGRIQDSSMTQNYGAIWLNYSMHVDVSNNHLFRNYIGANFGGGALVLTATNDTTIANNNVTDNTRSNIIVNQSTNVNITGNTASQTGGIASIGVWIISSTNMMIVNNTISYNTHFGLFLAGSTGVHIYHNTFFGNYPDAQDVNGGVNMWDNGYPSGGNYWYDYWYYFQAEDNCNGPNQNICTGPDGIGDTPYVLQTGQKDHYPLVFHDGTILNVQAPSTIVRGRTALVNVTAENLGIILEKRFTVTLSYGSTQVGSQTLTDFLPDKLTFFNFSWNTGTLLDGGVPPSNYTLTASVNIPMDTNSTNNSKSTSIQVVAFPITPLFLIGGVEQLLVIGAVIIAAGVIIAWVVLILLKRDQMARGKTGMP